MLFVGYISNYCSALSNKIIISYFSLYYNSNITNISAIIKKITKISPDPGFEPGPSG